MFEIMYSFARVYKIHPCGVTFLPLRNSENSRNPENLEFWNPLQKPEFCKLTSGGRILDFTNSGHRKSKKSVKEQAEVMVKWVPIRKIFKR